MASVFLGLGSNIDAVKNLSMAVSELRRRYGALTVSSVYRNAPVGFEGEDFLNLVVGLSTHQSPQEIVSAIGQIHDKSGRERGCARFIARPLDIDLLLYDRQVTDVPRLPRPDVLNYSFVLVPLSEIAGDYVHPLSGRTLAEHRGLIDDRCHPLQRENVIL